MLRRAVCICGRVFGDMRRSRPCTAELNGRCPMLPEALVELAVALRGACRLAENALEAA